MRLIVLLLLMVAAALAQPSGAYFPPLTEFVDNHVDNVHPNQRGAMRMATNVVGVVPSKVKSGTVYGVNSTGTLSTSKASMSVQ